MTTRHNRGSETKPHLRTSDVELSQADQGVAASTRASLRAIVFDMDGTLVSSLPVIFHCENEISRKYLRYTLALEDVISKFGPPAHAIIRNMTAGLSENLQSQAVTDYYECYRTHVARRALVFPGILQLLQRIQSSGRRLALVTGVEKVMMEYTLNPFNLSELFEIRITADDVQKSKPDPEGINLALKRIEVNPRESMYVGDSPADIIAGKRAGVLTGAAMWSPENRGDPTTEHPDHEFLSVQQLSDFLFPKNKSSPEPYFGSRWIDKRR
jgi:HAD superfamily hydrolase (TIGR01509 family)